MEFLDPTPDPAFPYTIFTTDGEIVDRACCYKSAAEGYGLTSDFGEMVVIMRTAEALPPTHTSTYH